MLPQRDFESVFTLFAYSASYVEDVVIGKHDFENLEEIHPVEPEPMRSVLEQLMKTPQLSSLTEKEIREIHGKAYHWGAEINIESLVKASQSGYLLRTRIRAAIELLDQKYQYGEAVIGTVTESSYYEEADADKF